MRAKISNVRGGFKVYACTEYNGLFWAKDQPWTKSTSGEWRTTYNEPGRPPKDGFRLTILLVPSDGVRVLDKWFADGKRTGDWPGLKLEQITGAEELASVKLKPKYD